MSSRPTPTRRRPGPMSQRTGMWVLSRPAIVAVDEGHPAHDQQPEARPQGGVAEVVLQVEDEVQEHRVERTVHGEGGGQSTAKGGDTEQRQVEQRVLRPALHRTNSPKNTAARTRQMTTPLSLQAISPARIRP